MTKYEKALLDMISFAEGTLGVSNNGYDVTVGFFTINGWTNDTDIKHGEMDWYNKELNSTAAGRYQIISGTWKEVLGSNLPMTKTNQDFAATTLINIKLKSTFIDNRSVDITNLEDKTQFDIMLSKLSSTWSSIPLTKTYTDGKGVTRVSGNSYYDDKKTSNSTNKLFQIYKKALSAY